MTKKILAKTKGYILSIRPETTPLGMISVYVGGLVAGAAFDSFNLLLAVIAVFFVTGGSMTFNDYFDWPVDVMSHPKRPIPKGVISPKEMLAFSIVFFTIGLAIAFYINLLCGAIMTGSLLLLVVYEIFTKNIGITGNLTVAFISAMSFTFGGASVNNPFASLVISIIAFFIIIGREIIMDIRDKEGDKQLRKTLPVQIGRKKASYVACVFLVLSAILTPLPYYLGILSIYYLIVIIPVAMISLLSIIWLLRDIENAGISAHLIRAALAIGLVAFIAGIVI